MDETSDSHTNNNHSNVPNGNCSSSSSSCESCSRDLAGDRHVQVKYYNSFKIYSILNSFKLFKSKFLPSADPKSPHFGNILGYQF